MTSVSTIHNCLSTALMTKDHRTTFTNMAEDFPFDPSLRIPPLLDPLPRLPSRRPSPLEPNARVNDGSLRATAKLSSRSKALDEAKPLGDDDIASIYPAPSRSDGHGSTKPDDIEDVSRKRQKVNPAFLHLPKPNSASKVQDPPLFNPVPILNELHEPPPSAALFPPITPNARRGKDGLNGSVPLQPLAEQKRGHDSESVPSETAAKAPPKEAKARAKRVYLRPRLKWTENETADLMKGVGIYGVGKWKKILTHPDFNFHSERTMVDLKDRYRTCRMNEEKAIERQASNGKGKQAQEGATGKTLDVKISAETRQDSVHREDSEGSPISKAADKVPSNPPESEFSVFTQRDFGNHANMSKGKRGGTSQPWTEEEDADLSKGYQKYGFQWTAIAKDKELCLGHRTGAQVRDRFRMKWPVVYQSSVPLPLPEATKRPARPKPDKARVQSSSASQNTKKSSSAELRFIINESHNFRRDEARTSSPPTNLPTTSRPSDGPSLESRSPITPTISDRFSGLDVQPLPEPEPFADEQEMTDYSDSSSGDVSRQSTVEAEEARHLSILGLLNEDAEQDNRLPSFKYPFDDEGWATENVTLPPLHWEDIASRPMFLD